MNPAKLFTTACLATVAVLFTSCGNQSKPDKSPKPSASTGEKFVNPYPPGTYEHFKADPKYPKTYAVWKNDQLLPKTNESNSHVVISLSKQRGFLMNGDEVVIDYPICSGIKSRPTPVGDFKVLEKVVDKQSNRYGKIYDATGNLVNGDADAQLDAIPEGGKFEGANMHYWMRLTWDGVGHHIGPVKRYPASHACVRGPSAVMPIVYSKMKVGSPISVQN
ncbi:MAG TPA: L,D-transpeptidase [Luteolibacter sp.]